MSRHPADAYIGLPWQPHGTTRAGVSCWGLVVLYYREQLGIALPEYGWAPEQVTEIAAEIERAFAAGEWVPSPMPRDGDMVTLSRRDAPHHLGIYAGGHVLHVTASMRAVCAQTAMDLARHRWGRVRYWSKT